MADRNDLLFVDANGEITNSTSADTLIYQGVSTPADGTADANPTNDLSLSSGNKTAGTGDSGNINISTGTSAGGSRGVVIVNADGTYLTSNGTTASKFETSSTRVWIGGDSQMADTVSTVFHGSDQSDSTSGATVFRGGDINSAGDAAYDAGDLTIRAGRGNGSTAGAVGSGNVTIKTDNAYRDAGATATGANSGDITIKTGSAAGDGTRGSITANAKSFLFGDGSTAVGTMEVFIEGGEERVYYSGLTGLPNMQVSFEGGQLDNESHTGAFSVGLIGSEVNIDDGGSATTLGTFNAGNAVVVGGSSDVIADAATDNWAVNSGSTYLFSDSGTSGGTTNNLPSNSGDVKIGTGAITNGGTKGKISIGDTFLDASAVIIDFNGNKLTNVGDGTADTDAATVGQLNASLEGLKPKTAVRVGTTAVLSGTMVADDTDQGSLSSGQRAYDTTALTISWFAGEGPTAIDGISINNGDRILVKDESATSGPSAGEGRTYNGIYVRTSADIWTRATDFDSTTPINEIKGAYVPVQEGTDNQGKFFVQQGAVTTLDADNIVFVFFNAVASGVTGGAGINVTGGNISIDLLDAGSGLKLEGVGDAAELAIDFAATFTIGSADQLAIKASDLAQTAGAGRVGILDSAAYYAGSSVESAFTALGSQIGGDSDAAYAFAEQNVLADDDAVYAALNKLDLKWGDLGSSANGEGASLVGVEDANGYYTGSNLETVLDEIGLSLASGAAESFTVENGYTTVLGDLLFVSSNDRVDNVDTSSGASGFEYGFALAGQGGIVGDAGGTTSVDAFHDGQVLTSCLPAATFTAGDRVYYDSSQSGSARFVTLANAPTSTGTRVWQVGVAKNTSDLVIDINYVKKNA